MTGSFVAPAPAQGKNGVASGGSGSGSMTTSNNFLPEPLY